MVNTEKPWTDRLKAIKDKSKKKKSIDEKKSKERLLLQVFLVSPAVTGILAKPGFLGIPSGKLQGEEQNETDLVIGIFFCRRGTKW